MNRKTSWDTANIYMLQNPRAYIFTNIMNQFDYHSVLTDRQHGFRSKHSTESQLILTTQDLPKENTPHGHKSHKSLQVYLKGQYSARYFFSLTLMICLIISIRQSACLQMTVYYTEK